MTQGPWLLHPEVLVELRSAAQWYEERAAGIGEDFVTLFERQLGAAAAHTYASPHRLAGAVQTTSEPHAVTFANSAALSARTP